MSTIEIIETLAKDRFHQPEKGLAPAQNKTLLELIGNCELSTITILTIYSNKMDALIFTRNDLKAKSFLK